MSGQSQMLLLLRRCSFIGCVVCGCLMVRFCVSRLFTAAAAVVAFVAFTLRTFRPPLVRHMVGFLSVSRPHCFFARLLGLSFQHRLARCLWTTYKLYSTPRRRDGMSSRCVPLTLLCPFFAFFVEVNVVHRLMHWWCVHSLVLQSYWYVSCLSSVFSSAQSSADTLLYVGWLLDCRVSTRTTNNQKQQTIPCSCVPHPADALVSFCSKYNIILYISYIRAL